MFYRWRIATRLTVCLLALVCASCGKKHAAITLAGSTAFQPFAEKLAEEFMAQRSGVAITVQGGGSAVGIQSAFPGAAQIGMADLVELPPEAEELIERRGGARRHRHRREPGKPDHGLVHRAGAGDFQRRRSATGKKWAGRTRRSPSSRARPAPARASSFEQIDQGHPTDQERHHSRLQRHDPRDCGQRRQRHRLPVARRDQ